jgi:hypothetical protein
VEWVSVVRLVRGRRGGKRKGKEQEETYPFETSPAVVMRSGVLVLRSKSVLHGNHHRRDAHADNLDKVFIALDGSHDETTAVEVDTDWQATVTGLVLGGVDAHAHVVVDVDVLGVDGIGEGGRHRGKGAAEAGELFALGVGGAGEDGAAAELGLHL